jgi:hypothetical protein
VEEDGRLADRGALQRRAEAFSVSLAGAPLTSAHDRALIVLLASTGVLQQRFEGRDPRWLARLVRDAVDPSLPAVAALARGDAERLRARLARSAGGVAARQFPAHQHAPPERSVW